MSFLRILSPLGDTFMSAARKVIPVRTRGRSSADGVTKPQGLPKGEFHGRPVFEQFTVALGQG